MIIRRFIYSTNLNNHKSIITNYNVILIRQISNIPNTENNKNNKNNENFTNNDQINSNKNNKIYFNKNKIFVIPKLSTIALIPIFIATLPCYLFALMLFCVYLFLCTETFKDYTFNLIVKFSKGEFDFYNTLLA
jgi:hypothetical protein